MEIVLVQCSTKEKFLMELRIQVLSEPQAEELTSFTGRLNQEPPATASATYQQRINISNDNSNDDGNDYYNPRGAVRPQLGQ
jgi:hypothetical protein